MKLIEVEAVLKDGGIILIPQNELDAMGLKTGDEISLVYLEQQEGSLRNDSIL